MENKSWIFSVSHLIIANISYYNSSVARQRELSGQDYLKHNSVPRGPAFNLYKIVTTVEHQSYF